MSKATPMAFDTCDAALNLVNERRLRRDLDPVSDVCTTLAAAQALADQPTDHEEVALRVEVLLESPRWTAHYKRGLGGGGFSGDVSAALREQGIQCSPFVISAISPHPTTGSTRYGPERRFAVRRPTLAEWVREHRGQRAILTLYSKSGGYCHNVFCDGETTYNWRGSSRAAVYGWTILGVAGVDPEDPMIGDRVRRLDDGKPTPPNRERDDE